ncbi:MAG: CDP-glycerol glycerophosphotransferase family protein [Patescibacteria group bacterium]|jgi:hypothetical protein
MKTLFITSFHSFISKNILNTDVLRILGGASDLRVVIFVPQSKVSFFERHYASENVRIEGVDVATITESKRNVFFSRLFFLMIRSHYLWYKRVERRDAQPTLLAWVKYVVYSGLVRVLSGSRALNRLARFASYRFTPKNILEAHFARYQPSLVFSTDVFDPVDAQFLKEAKYHHVATLGMVRSWDNCYSKGLMPVLPDALLTNNELIKEEAVTLHNYPAERVTVVGLPQFDAFVREERISREAFFKSIGVDPSQKLVLFAPAGSILSDTDWQTCEILENARAKGEIRHPVHFFVRNHPGHPADLSRFKENPHFTIQNPGQIFDTNSKNNELDPRDQKELADLLYHSDVVLFVATTLGLDATVYDKPQIMIDFDGYEKKDYTKSVARYHDEDHMKKYIATAGVRVVRDAKELIDSINAYLENPQIDSEGRDSIVREQLFKIDGKSGERVAEQILKSLSASYGKERNNQKEV